MPDCNHNTDPQKLVREGTSQEQRLFQALDPAYAPVNEQTPAHSMVFAQAYAAYLRFFDAGDVPIDDWRRFFEQDVSVQLAIAAIQEVDLYKTRVLEYFRYLNNRNNDLNTTIGNQELKKRLGYLFSCIGTLARQLDKMKESLPPEIGLKSTLQNLIKTQLSAGFGRLINYYRGGTGLALIDTGAHPDFNTLGSPSVPFEDILSGGLSKDWITNASLDWITYETGIIGDSSVYGSGSTVFDQINHLSTHNLFTSVFDQFLKVYARTVADAKKSLESTFTNWTSHEPHYALFLAFLRLFENARTEMNTLTGRHLDFYYKDILQLREKPAQPGHAHLLVELAKHAAVHELNKGTFFKAGKDALGKDAFFVNDRDFVANQAKVSALKTVYRHGNEPVGTGTNANKQTGRLYASPVANSDDGLGAKLTSTDQSWHPFYNKIYDDGALQEIKMPTAEIGFAIASNHFYLTEGFREIQITLNLKTAIPSSFLRTTIYLSTEKGWHQVDKDFTLGGISPVIDFELEGDVPAITPYLAKTHGGNFDTPHPMVKIILRQMEGQLFDYASWENAELNSIGIKVFVGLDAVTKAFSKTGLKNLAVSNDFGPVDVSKTFQPFGAQPSVGAKLIIGHNEIFQKNEVNLKLKIKWKGDGPAAGKTVTSYYLDKSDWQQKAIVNLKAPTGFTPFSSLSPVNYEPSESYSVEKTSGFLQLVLSGDFGHKDYPALLAEYLTKIAKGETNPVPGKPALPYTPEIESIWVAYAATAPKFELNTAIAPTATGPKFFHLIPFGHAERHQALGDGRKVTLFPAFQHITNTPATKHEAEFYIGITGLKPPQNIALLFQVAEGTADPLSKKPEPHLHWSYLHDNVWTTFDKDAVEDGTGELTRSGIVTLAMPSAVSDDNTLLPAGMHWIRIAVENESDTVCRFITVAAQALQATFTNRDNDPAFSANPLEAGTIAKLDQPDAAVKKIEQPFATFGGRGKEASNAYYTRVSERLRHKERAIALWDYERLVLEAFPQVYRVKCLNHTEYEPNLSGSGIYRELAAGHVTVVTIPNQQFQNLRDPLRPYTSLGLLLEIEAFLKERLSCFVKLHVKNPQFEEIRLDFRVRFYPGFDETYYTNQLKREITRYLSPWAFPGGGSPSFGGKIFKSVLINFVEERPFVDYVTDFKMFHNVGGKQGTVDLNEVEGSTAVSVLVSVPEEKHSINSIIVASASTQTPGDPCPCQT